MKRITDVLSRNSRELPGSLRGDSWQFFGGSDVTDWLTSTSFILATDSKIITITSEVSWKDFEGEDDTYSCLTLEADAVDHDRARSSGHLYFFHQGQEVRDLMVVRDLITEEQVGIPTWQYVTDVAVIDCLSDGVVCARKVSDHNELVAMAHAPTIEALAVPEPSHRWTNEIGLTYTFERQVIPVDALSSDPEA